MWFLHAPAARDVATCTPCPPPPLRPQVGVSLYDSVTSQPGFAAFSSGIEWVLVGIFTFEVVFKIAAEGAQGVAAPGQPLLTSSPCPHPRQPPLGLLQGLLERL